MATNAQIAANQANAQHSTGPRTAEGKARVAANPLQHGFRSASVLIPGEDPAEFDALRAAIEDEYRPEGHEQTRCVEEMAAAWWRLQRSRAFQQDILTRKIEELRPDHVDLSPVSLACRAEEELHRDSKYYVSLIRYEARYDRQYERARRILLQSRKEEGRTSLDVLKEQIASEIETSKANFPPPPEHLTARNAPCPCGSGEKYKRCCGPDAPPVYNAA